MRSHRLPVLLTALTITLGLGLAGCGGDDAKAKPKPAETSVTGPGSDPSENFDAGKQFIDALAENSATSLATAKSLTAPGSAAERYISKTASTLDGAPNAGLRTMTELSVGVYRLCASSGQPCIKISGLILANGKISSFKVNGKQMR